MPGINLILPLKYDPSDGPYKTTKNEIEAIKQNLRFCFECNPGERLMDINFGCGLRRFLFEPITPILISDIEEVIKDQINRYFSYLKVVDLVVLSPEESNSLVCRVYFQLNGFSEIFFYEYISE